VNQSGRKRMITPNAICHVEIPAPELQKSKAFYERVFGWRMHDLPGQSYALFAEPTIPLAFPETQPPVSGGLDADRSPVAQDAGVLLYISCHDIDGKLAAIEAAGGQTATGKTRISEEYGFYARFLDPCGNPLGLWSAE